MRKKPPQKALNVASRQRARPEGGLLTATPLRGVLKARSTSPTVLTTRNISSTPSPIARNGRTCVVAAVKGRPSRAHRPSPEATDPTTRATPASPRPALESFGLPMRAREQHAYST